MDADHLMAAVRYVALNPVRAGLTERAQDWPLASTRTLLAGKWGRHLNAAPALDRCAGQFVQMIETEPPPNRRTDRARREAGQTGQEAKRIW